MDLIRKTGGRMGKYKSAKDLVRSYFDALEAANGQNLESVLSEYMSEDSLLNSMSTVYVKDIHERFFSKNNEEASLRLSMLISAAWGFVIIGVTLMAFSGTTRSILDVVGSYISYISGPMCGAFFLALFTRKANDKGVAIGVIIGFLVTYMFGTTAGASWIWKPAVGLISTFGAGLVASFLFRADKALEEVSKLTVVGLRKYMIESGQTIEDGVSIVPLTFDKYAKVVLAFFLVQYIFLALIAM